MTEIQIPRCQNCGGIVGPLEPVKKWKGYWICGACRERLSGRNRTPAVVSVAAFVFLVCVVVYVLDAFMKYQARAAQDQQTLSNIQNSKPYQSEPYAGQSASQP